MVHFTRIERSINAAVAGSILLITVMSSLICSALASPTTTTAINSFDPTPVATPLAQLVPRQQPAGETCFNEGIWNCMSTSWQRCASGHWSVVMYTAYGTACTPMGESYDFVIEHVYGYGVSSAANAGPNVPSATRSSSLPWPSGVIVSAASLHGRSWAWMIVAALAIHWILS